MTKMSAQAIEIRKKMLKDMAAKYGQAVVDGWATDPAKVSMLNAMAQIEADGKR